MTTDITPFPASHTSVPSHAEPLKLTASLAYHVAGDTLVDGHYSPVHGHPSRADVTEAQSALPRADHLCRAVDPRVVAAWMEKFRGLPKAPVEHLREAIAAMMLANGDLPAAVWTAETAGEGLRTFRWYPTPAEVRTLLLPRAQAFWRQRDGLRRVVEWSEPAVTTREPATPDAQAYVGNLVRTFAAERSFSQSASLGDGKPAVKARPLSPVALTAAYRRLAKDGDVAAETRLRMLDRRGR